MKKQASDQLSHERRYLERKRAEAARKPVKKAASGTASPVVESPTPTGPAKS